MFNYKSSSSSTYPPRQRVRLMTTSIMVAAIFYTLISINFTSTATATSKVYSSTLFLTSEGLPEEPSTSTDIDVLKPAIYTLAKDMDTFGTTLNSAERDIVVLTRQLNTSKVTLTTLLELKERLLQDISLYKQKSLDFAVTSYMGQGAPSLSSIIIRSTDQLGRSHYLKTTAQYSRYKVATATVELADTIQKIDQEVTIIEALSSALDATNRLFIKTNSSVSNAQTGILSLLNSAGQPGRPSSRPAITILGPVLLSPEQLVAWVLQNSPSPPPEIDLLFIANTFITEGKLEGVRGDIAFIQASLETGFFRTTTGNNFAGIGNCDSCGQRGYRFDTVALGIRAQIQLLAFYAQASITEQDLRSPPAMKLANLGVKGCCKTWYGLTGVWATAIHYGTTIVRLYEDALALALLTPQADPVL